MPGTRKSRVRGHKTRRPRKSGVHSALYIEEILLGTKATGWTVKRILAYEQETRSRAWDIAARGSHSSAAQRAANRFYRFYYPFRIQYRESVDEWRTRVAKVRWEDIPSWEVHEGRTLVPPEHAEGAKPEDTDLTSG